VKNGFTTVRRWKKELFLPANTDQRFGYIVWTSTENWVRLYSCRLSRSIFYSAMQSISQL